jgi:hypothetical protein
MQKENLREELVPCGCGRSPTGYCVGLHEMSEQEYEEYLLRDGFDGTDE